MADAHHELSLSSTESETLTKDMEASMENMLSEYDARIQALERENRKLQAELDDERARHAAEVARLEVRPGRRRNAPNANTNARAARRLWPNAPPPSSRWSA